MFYMLQVHAARKWPGLRDRIHILSRQRTYLPPFTTPIAAHPLLKRKRVHARSTCAARDAVVIFAGISGQSAKKHILQGFYNCIPFAEGEILEWLARVTVLPPAQSLLQHAVLVSTYHFRTFPNVQAKTFQVYGAASNVPRDVQDHGPWRDHDV